MAYQIEFKAMGTQILAILDAPASDTEILTQVPFWFEEWEAILSRFRPQSELNTLNRSQGKAFRMSQTGWEVLQLSLEMEKESGGLVSPAILQALEAAGYDRNFEWLQPNQASVGMFQNQVVGLAESIRLDPVHRMVVLSPGIKLDFGGTAKGWAVHQAMLRLSQFGPTLVDGGGDIAISGPLLDGSPWPVEIEDPLQQWGEPIIVELTDRCIATSGRNRRKWQQNGVWQHHLIDPRFGKPADTDVMTATVMAPDVMHAEMAAKVIFILGSEEGLKWLKSKPDYSALIVLEDGRTTGSPVFSENELRQEWNR
jgi:FAD:protein FMN transferase